MKVQQKFMILLLSTSLVIISSLIGYQYLSLQQKKIFYKINEQSHADVIDNVIHLRSEQFEDFARDYSGWDEMLDFSKKVDKQWAEHNIDLSLYTYKLSFWSVYNKNEENIYFFKDTTCSLKDTRLLTENLNKIFSKNPINHFYLFIDEHLYEIIGATIVSSQFVNYRVGIPANGYMFVAKEWSKQFVTNLEKAVNFNIIIHPYPDLDSSNFHTNDQYIINNKTLNDFEGKPIADIHFIKPNSLKRELSSSLTITYFIIGSIILTLIIFLILFRIYFVKPIKSITNALIEGEQSNISQLKKNKDEFGEIARMIEKSFEHDLLIKEVNNKLINQTEEIQAQKDLLVESKEELTAINRELWFQTHALNETSYVTITDSCGNITYANDKFCSIMGYPFEELIGQNHRILKSGIHTDEVFSIMWQTISVEKRIWRSEVCNKTKNGDLVWFDSFIVPFLNEKAEPYQYMAMRFDITDKKRAEEESIFKNNELKRKNQEIENITNQIMSSLEYAHTIQLALLPSDEFLTQLIPDHFVFYNPLEIVSGDFYWANIYKEKIMFAVGDCTGHGVPGAMMSMLGISFLNDIYKSHELSEAHLMINELRNRIINNLHQTGKIGEHHDGMDIALGIINLETYDLEYSGAFNPIVIIRKDCEEISGYENMSLNGFTAHVLKGDRMPVGFYHGAQQSFSKHTWKLQKDDTLYFFTDGFIDQTGGGDHKKYRLNNFVKTLLQIQEYPMQVQHLALNQVLIDWMGDSHQVDDILVMGVKI